MGKFVEEDFNNITVVKCNTISCDDTHDCYKVVVKDENDNYYIWKDEVTDGAAEQADILVAIKAHLLTVEKKELVVKPIINIIDNDEITGISLA